jgi:hypothetical protein
MNSMRVIRTMVAIVAIASLTAGGLPATDVYQGDEGGGNDECGTNRNATDGQGNRYHASASQPLAQGYNNEGVVPAVNYHTATGMWYHYSQEVGVHQQ